MKIYHLHIKSTGEDFYYSLLKDVVNNHATVVPSYSTLKNKLKISEYNSKKCSVKKGVLVRAKRNRVKK